MPDLNSSFDTENVTYVEPYPDWPKAEFQWKAAWPLHTYGMASTFLLLTVYAAFTLCQLRRRLRYLPFVAATNILSLLLGSIKMFVLFVDPYSSRNILPRSLLRVLEGFTYPFIISIFTLVEFNIMQITRVRIGPERKQNTRWLIASLMCHFLIVFTIYLTVAIHNSLKLLILLSQAIFITWGFVLCFIFVYNAFKIVQFTKETGKVLQQIVAYTRVKKHLSKSGNHRDLALHRIRKTRIRKEPNVDNLHFSEESHVTDAESSDSLCFFNEAHYELDENKLEELYTQKQILDKSTRPQIALGQSSVKPVLQKKKRKRQRSSNWQNKSPYNISVKSSSESNSHMTDTPSTPGVMSLEEQLMAQLHQQYLSDSLQAAPCPTRDGYCALRNSPSVSSHEQYFINGAKLTFDSNCNKGYRSQKVCNAKGTKVDKIDRNGIRYDPLGCTQIRIEEEKPIDENIQECSGYMADTEHTSPKQKVKSKHLVSATDETDDCDESPSPNHCPYPLPIRDNSLGLYRIRQGQILRKVLKVSYACATFAFTCCVLQLYAMFGVYGVLSNIKVAAPWPWYVFMTCSRLCELGLLWTCAYIMHTIGHQRYRSTKRCRRRPARTSTSC